MGYEVYLFFGGGVILGICITYLIERLRTVFGILKIDRSDPEKDVYSIDVENLDSLSERKRVILKIKDITHK